MPPDPREDLLECIGVLQERLDEAEETLRALRNGEVDAIVAAGPDGDRVYTLRGADEAYRIMMQQMAEGALTLTPDGLILFSNEQFAAMLCCPLERVIGSRIYEFVAPENADIVSAILSGTGVRKAEVRLSRGNAADIPVYLSAQNVVLGGIDCHCLIVTHLSEQKRHEEIVAVLEAVPVAVFIAQDPKCHRIVGNRMAYELLSMPPGANVSASASEREKPRCWREVKDGKDIPAEDLPMQTAARTGQPVHDYEFDLLADDGTSRCWLGNAVPLFDEKRQSRGAVGAFVDITERKQAGEALEASNAELRNFGNALTQHLREPLDMVVKFTRLLAQEFPGALDVDTNISNALACALRVEALMKALREYWEDTERGGGILSPVDCNQVLSQALLSLRTELRQSDAIVTLDPLPTVVAEDRMLERVFRTLVDNSIKYRDQEALRIHISAVRTFDRWLFSVRDNGIGIDPKDAEWVFGMFNRLHGDEIPGTGIALALCKKMIERHGGRIWVESRAGKGAAFRFTIPTYLASAPPLLASS
jgi:signal transduction histidine kinase